LNKVIVSSIKNITLVLDYNLVQITARYRKQVSEHTIKKSNEYSESQEYSRFGWRWKDL